MGNLMPGLLGYKSLAIIICHVMLALFKMLSGMILSVPLITVKQYHETQSQPTVLPFSHAGIT